MLNEKEVSKAGPMATVNVSIDDAVWQKINYWIQKAPGEVSGLGKLIRVGETFRVIDAILIKQENTASSTDLDPASVARAMFELRETPGHLNFWWHSHVNMDVFWSGTDIDTIREIGRHGFVVSTVLNKKRQMLSSLYVRETEMVPEIFVNELPTVVQKYIAQETFDVWDREYETKCAPKKYISEYDWRKDRSYNGYGHDFGGAEGTDSSMTIDRAAATDPFHGKHDNEGYRSQTSDDAPSTVSSRTLEHDLNDPYLCLEIVEDWGEDMERAVDEREAKSILTLVCRALWKLQNEKAITQEEQERLKDEYIERYNLSRTEFRNYNKELAN